MSEHDKRPREQFRGLITALQTLTCLPIRANGAKRLADSLRWFPIVGFLLGCMVSLIGQGALEVTNRWGAAAAVAMLVASAMLTRALHLDGLSDWADGFWGGYDRERRLAIMKDSSLGTFGTVALVCLLLGKWVALTRIVQNEHWGVIVLAFVISRTMQVVLASAQPYARAGGGTGSPFIEDAKANDAYWSLGVAALICLVMGDTQPLNWLVVLAAAWGLTVLFGLWCKQRVGGVTGDLLGACSELTELLVLATGGVIGIG